MFQTTVITYGHLVQKRLCPVSAVVEPLKKLSVNNKRGSPQVGSLVFFRQNASSGCSLSPSYAAKRRFHFGITFLHIFLVLSPTLTAAQEVRLVADTARDALNEASLLRELRNNDDAVPQDFVAAARADYRRLLTALYAEGRYGGSVSITIDGVEASTIEPLAAPGRIDEIIIAVEAGPRFTFGDVALEPLPPGTILPEDLGPRRTARTERIRTAVSTGIDSWRDLGYATVQVSEQQIIARHADRKLDVFVGFAPGPQLRFGNLSVSGNENVDTGRIREIAGLPAGEVFSPAAMETAEQRLRRTGAFDSVALAEASTVGPNDTLPIEAQVVESKPRRIGFGLEFSSIEGLTLSSFWLHRNLLGGAERFRVSAEVAGIDGETGGTDYALRGNFTRPATFDPDTDFFIQGEVSREDEPDYLLDKVSLETGFTRIISDDLTASAGIGLLTAREESDLGSREYTLLTFPLGATLDRRNEPTNTTDGYFADLSVTPFVSIEGDVNGGRVFADTRIYQTVSQADWLTFAARGQIGSVLGASIDEAPADFLFYSGGGGTVRGQPYKSLGVDRVSGMETVTTGGTSFLGAQLEARFAIGDRTSLVGFYDIGHVGDTETPGQAGDWHAGMGFGLRYETGIGPIRLDLATPANGDDAGENLQVYIGIGQAF